MRFDRVLAGAFALSLTATAADAAVTIHTSSFITTPIATNDFETISPALYPFNTPYAQGGVTVSYVTTSIFDEPYNGGAILTGFPLAGTTGSHSWVNIDNHGYTSIRLTDGSSFDQVQFAALSGRDGYLYYQLMYQGSVVSTGIQSGIAIANVDPANVFGFSGELFDEIRVKNSSVNVTQFEASANDALYIDDIAIGRTAPVNGAVPEPATWAMLVFGFGTIGTMMRRPRQLAIKTA